MLFAHPIPLGPSVAHGRFAMMVVPEAVQFLVRDGIRIVSGEVHVAMTRSEIRDGAAERNHEVSASAHLFDCVGVSFYDGHLQGRPVGRWATRKINRRCAAGKKKEYQVSHAARSLAPSMSPTVDVL